MTETVLLIIVVVTALGFDFTNGFHDTANAMATSIATGALKPHVAVALSAALNLVGAFLSLSVAATIASGLVQSSVVTLPVVLAGLAGAITWNLLTWYVGLPSSSSHALIGGVIGATLATAGGSGVQWDGVVSKVIVPAALAPVIAGGIAVVGTVLIYRISRDVPGPAARRGFRVGQVGSASLVSLAHGTNDAQKTMGVITLALVAAGTLPAGTQTPTWVIVSCAVAISLGTFSGGWRIIKTLGTGLVDIRTRQGMAAESSSAAVILLSSFFGYSLSTTHVATGSILGTGVGYRRADVRWSVAGRIAVAWLLTLPASALVGALAAGLGRVLGGTVGTLVIAGLLGVGGLTLFLVARRQRVGSAEVVQAASAALVEEPAPPDEPPITQNGSDDTIRFDGRSGRS